MSYDGRSRSFFFFNYEGIRYDSTTTVLTRVPTERERRGDFSETFIRTANGEFRPAQIYDPATTRANPAGSGFVRDALATPLIPSQRLDPVALRALQSYPLPNRAPADLTGRDNFISTPGIVSDTNQFTTRVDHQITDANRLFVRYSQSDAVNTGNAPIFAVDNIADPRSSLQTRHNKSVTIGRHAYVQQPRAERSAAVRSASVPVERARRVQHRRAAPDRVAGDRAWRPLTRDSTSAMCRRSAARPDQLSQRGLTVGQLTNSLSIVWGKHTMKTGIDIRVHQRNNFQPGAISGQFDFSRAMSGNPQDTSGNTGFGLATFLLGAVSGGSLNSALARADGFHYYAAFVQDDYRMRPA